MVGRFDPGRRHQKGDLLPVVSPLAGDLVRVINPGSIEIAPASAGGQKACQRLDRSVVLKEAVADGLAVVIQRTGDEVSSAGQTGQVFGVAGIRMIEAR